MDILGIDSSALRKNLKTINDNSPSTFYTGIKNELSSDVWEAAAGDKKRSQLDDLNAKMLQIQGTAKKYLFVPELVDRYKNAYNKKKELESTISSLRVNLNGELKNDSAVQRDIDMYETYMDNLERGMREIEKELSNI